MAHADRKKTSFRFTIHADFLSSVIIQRTSNLRSSANTENYPTKALPPHTPKTFMGLFIAWYMYYKELKEEKVNRRAARRGNIIANAAVDVIDERNLNPLSVHSKYTQVRANSFTK